MIARLLGAVALCLAAWAFSTAGVSPYYTAAGLMVVGLWFIVRGQYLTRWKLEFCEEGVRVLGPGEHGEILKFSDICHARLLGPSVRLLGFHLSQHPTRPRVVGSQFDGGERIRTVAVPLGLDGTSVWRRCWTLSQELLLLEGSGRWALIPLGAVAAGKRRELWIRLFTEMPPVLRANALRTDPAMMKKAGQTEQEGEAAQRDRHWAIAAEYFTTAAICWQREGQMDSVLRCHEHRTTCLIRLGSYKEAEGVADHALTLATNLRSASCQATALNLQADVAQNIGDLAAMRKAVSLLEEACGIHRRRGERFLELRMRSNQAIIWERIYCFTHDPTALAKAREAAEGGLKLLGRTLSGGLAGEVPVQHANILGTLARVEFYQGRWDEAVALFARAYQLSETAGGRMIVEDLAMSGRAQFLACRHGASATHLSTAARCAREQEAIKTLDRAVALSLQHGDYAEALFVRVQRADTFWDRGLFSAALCDYETVIASLEQGAFLLDRSFERTALLGRHRSLYDRVTEGWMQIAAADGTGSRDARERAFQNSERTKARLFSECLNLGNLLSHLADPQTRAELEAASIRYKSVLWGRNGQTALEEIQDYNATVARIMQGHPEITELLRRRLPSLDEMRSWLPRQGDAAILSLAMLDGGLAVFFITPDLDFAESCFLLRGLDRQTLEAEFFSTGWLKTYEDHVRARADPGNEEEANRLLVTSIEQLPFCIDQIKQGILRAQGPNGTSIEILLRRSRVRRLVLVPDRFLARLPFHAALEGLDVSFCPSAAALVGTLTRGIEHPDHALLVSNPGHSPALQHGAFVEEAAEVRTQMQQHGWQVEELQDEQATASSILTHMPRATLFHFCGHAQSDLHAPLQSTLLVAPAASTLSAETVLVRGALRSGAWVVLTACETGIARTEAAGEFLGLPAAFLGAGAGLVISSLWAVHRDSPVALMAEFYSRLPSHDFSAPAALADAAMKLREHGIPSAPPSLRVRTIANKTRCNSQPATPAPAVWASYAHPFHSAAFVLWGPAWKLREVAAPTPIGGHMQPLPAPIPNMGQATHPDAAAVLREADQFIAAGRHADVIQFLAGARGAALAGSPAAWGRLGDCHAITGNYAEAIDYYSRILALDRNSYQAHYNIGCVYQDFAQVPEAEAAFLQSLALNPTHASSMINLAELATTPAQALSLLEAAQALTPDDPVVPKGIAMWNELKSHSPVELARLRLVWAAEANGKAKHRQARRMLTLARLGTSDQEVQAAAFNLEADIARQNGDISASIALLRKAVAANPRVPAYWNNIGARSLLLPGPVDFKEATEALHKAIQLGAYARPHQNLANIFLNKGQLDLARLHAAQAMEMVRRQQLSSKHGPLICKGCPTMGQHPSECEECLHKSEAFQRDLGLLGGDYTV